jgi:hypothetical protein
MYQAQADHWGAKILGFLVAPAVLGITAGALESKILNRPLDMQDAVLIDAASAIAFYYFSTQLTDLSAQAFARGGMWGSVANIALAPGARRLGP